MGPRLLWGPGRCGRGGGRSCLEPAVQRAETWLSSTARPDVAGSALLQSLHPRVPGRWKAAQSACPAVSP